MSNPRVEPCFPVFYRTGETTADPILQIVDTKYFASWAQIGALKNLELMDNNDKYLNEDVPISGNKNMST